LTRNARLYYNGTIGGLMEGYSLLVLLMALIAMFIGATGFFLGVMAYIKITAMEKSTHTVQLMPVDEEIDRANEEYLKKWGTSQEAIDREQKLYKEELEDEMPEFHIDDKEKEIFSL
jgi:phage shock protein PspC (stress-responsive transcriptional regulator)